MIAPFSGYIIPNGVVIDTDNFHSYMVLLFCKEGTYGIAVFRLFQRYNIRINHNYG